MKKRASVNKAEWSETREEHYERTARDIAYANGFSIALEDGKTVSVRDGHKSILCAPSRPKRLWFETWCRLMDEYPNSKYPDK
jgi:hypothetical protein